MLVTANDTSAEARNESTGHDGSGGMAMFFRVNGAAIYARGANKVLKICVLLCSVRIGLFYVFV